MITLNISTYVFLIDSVQYVCFIILSVMKHLMDLSSIDTETHTSHWIFSIYLIYC